MHFACGEVHSPCSLRASWKLKLWYYGTVEPLGTDTFLLWTVSYVTTKFSYISSKKTSIIWTLSNTGNRHKISALGTKFMHTITDTVGQGVDNLWHMYPFLSAVTQTLTLYQSVIPIPEHVLGKVFCLFQNSYVQHVTEKFNNINQFIFRN